MQRCFGCGTWTGQAVCLGAFEVFRCNECARQFRKRANELRALRARDAAAGTRDDTADAAGAALVATLCGCWWAAPTGRLLTPEGDIVPSVCGACGAQSGCLVLHLLMGQYSSEAACRCPRARTCRCEWVEEVGQLYEEHLLIKSRGAQYPKQND